MDDEAHTSDAKMGIWVPKLEKPYLRCRPGPSWSPGCQPSIAPDDTDPLRATQYATPVIGRNLISSEEMLANSLFVRFTNKYARTREYSSV